MLWHEIGAQLRHPTGVGGWAIGHFMRLVNARTNRLAVDRLDISSHSTVLELGCGPGHGIALAARRAGTVYGLDQSAAMLRQARRRNRRLVERGRVMLREAHFNALPVESKSIDCALAVNVIYFWRDMMPVAAELRRVLKPGGKLAIYATSRESMRGWKFATSATHRLFDEKDLLDALQAEGFDGCEISVSKVKVARHIDGLIAEVTMPVSEAPMSPAER